MPAKIKIIDVHAHLQFPIFKNDVDAVVKRSLEQGIGMINAGVSKETSWAAVELAHNYPDGVWAAIGLHPTDADEYFDYDYYKKLAADSKVVAIGECGLDYYRNSKIKDKQKEVFIRQIEFAGEVKKPLVIHCRSAFDDLTDILNSQSRILNSQPGIIHFFSGSQEDAQRLLNLGFSFTFGGVITFARDYDEVIKFLPLDRILLETDAPYVAPAPYRGRRNEPVYIIEIAQKIAEIKNLSYEKIAAITTANALRIFNI